MSALLCVHPHTEVVSSVEMNVRIFISGYLVFYVTAERESMIIFPEFLFLKTPSISIYFCLVTFGMCERAFFFFFFLARWLLSVVNFVCCFFLLYILTACSCRINKTPKNIKHVQQSQHPVNDIQKSTLQKKKMRMKNSFKLLRKFMKEGKNK